MPADDERTEAHAAFYIESTDAFRRVQFVAGKTQHVNGKPGKVHFHFADRLYGVRMEQGALTVRQFGEFFYRINVADLIVRPHNGNDRGFRVDHLLGTLHIEPAFGIDRNMGNGVSAPLQLFAESENRGVFHAGDHDFAAFRAEAQRAVNRRTVAFRSAAGENDFGRLCAEEPGKLFAGCFDMRRDLSAERMNA